MRDRSLQRAVQAHGAHKPPLRALVAVAAASLTACTVLQPVSVPPHGRLIGPAAAAAAASAPAGTAAVERANACATPEKFAGELGSAICLLDARRMELLEQAATVSNTTVAFNALSWPIGAAVLYDRLRSPSSSLLLPAAIAAGAYGFLNAGIPGREKLYLSAARQLACRIVESGGHLYTVNEVTSKMDTFYTDGSRSLPGLDQSLAALRAELQRYDQARSQMLGSLKLRPAARAATPTTLDRLVGGGRSPGGSGPVTDHRQQIDDQTWALMQVQAAVLVRGKALSSRIAGSGNALLARWSGVEAELQSQLIEKTPPLAKPNETGAALTAMINAAISQSGMKTDAAARDAASGHWLPREWLDGLTAESRVEVLQFERVHVVGLRASAADVNAWLDDHAVREARARDSAAAIGCPALEAPSKPVADAKVPSVVPLPNAGAK